MGKAWPLSDEHRKAISESLSGRKKSRAHREAISMSAPGWSDEARRRSKAARMHKAETKRKMVAKIKHIDAEETKALQRAEVKQLTSITSPRLRMLWDRKYVSARTMTPKDLALVWTVTAKQHGFYHGKTKHAVTTKGMKAFVKLRTWLADIGIYPERYFRAVFGAASFARSRGRRWQPYVTAAASNHYYQTYVEWEKRLVTYDEGWIELMKETGVSRLPTRVQDSILESAESMAHIAGAVSETIDAMVDRYFVDLSPYLLFFMPQAQVYINAGRGTKEQHSVFRSLRFDAKLRAKYEPFYNAATKYFKILENDQERRNMAKAKIDRMLREQQEAAIRAVGTRLDNPLELR